MCRARVDERLYALIPTAVGIADFDLNTECAHGCVHDILEPDGACPVNCLSSVSEFGDSFAGGPTEDD